MSEVATTTSGNKALTLREKLDAARQRELQNAGPQSGEMKKQADLIRAELRKEREPGRIFTVNARTEGPVLCGILMDKREFKPRDASGNVGGSNAPMGGGGASAATAGKVSEESYNCTMYVTAAFSSTKEYQSDAPGQNVFMEASPDAEHGVGYMVDANTVKFPVLRKKREYDQHRPEEFMKCPYDVEVKVPGVWSFAAPKRLMDSIDGNEGIAVMGVRYALAKWHPGQTGDPYRAMARANAVRFTPRSDGGKLFEQMCEKNYHTSRLEPFPTDFTENKEASYEERNRTEELQRYTHDMLLVRLDPEDSAEAADAAGRPFTATRPMNKEDKPWEFVQPTTLQPKRRFRMALYVVQPAGTAGDVETVQLVLDGYDANVNVFGVYKLSNWTMLMNNTWHAMHLGLLVVGDKKNSQKMDETDGKFSFQRSYNTRVTLFPAAFNYCNLGVPLTARGALAHLMGAGAGGDKAAATLREVLEMRERAAADKMHARRVANGPAVVCVTELHNGEFGDDNTPPAALKRFSTRVQDYLAFYDLRLVLDLRVFPEYVACVGELTAENGDMLAEASTRPGGLMQLARDRSDAVPDSVRTFANLAMSPDAWSGGIVMATRPEIVEEPAAAAAAAAAIEEQRPAKAARIEEAADAPEDDDPFN